MKIAIANDHGGYEYKLMLLPFIEGMGHTVTDFGSFSAEAADYFDPGLAAAEAVSRGEADRAVLICGTGIGMCITANKVKGVRCALCTDPLMAELTRLHNDANALALGGRIIGPELCKAIVKAYLDTEFSQEERHARRIGKIAAYEERRG